jgi:hypothetical protein
MGESILTSIKKLLGIAEEYTHFDQDIIIHINSVFMILNQIGIGPSEPFQITGSDEIWMDFSSDIKNLGCVKSYIYLKVKMLFDPPLSGSVVESTNKLISELEWRLSITEKSEHANGGING